MTVGGIVLCGGRSRRMGRPKLSLPFGNELLLQRVVRILGEVVGPIVVVASAQQDVPDLPRKVRVLRDDEPGRGPLAGLAVGLEFLRDLTPAALVTACDAPLLQPAFLRQIITSLEGYEIAIPRDARGLHPLLAAYSTELTPLVQELLKTDQLRMGFLVERAKSRFLDAEQLRASDPELHSLKNVNSPEDYVQTCLTAGFQPSDLPIQEPPHSFQTP